METVQTRSPRNAGTRRDPRPRRVDAMEKAGQFKQLDPKRHYVAVYKAAEENGIGEYEERGYVVELVRADGPRSITGTKTRGEGQPVEYRGHVLMSIEREELAAQEAQGQAEADALERRIIRRDGMVDHMRGIHGLRGRDGTPVVSLENDTKALEQEIENG